MGCCGRGSDLLPTFTLATKVGAKGPILTPPELLKNSDLSIFLPLTEPASDSRQKCSSVLSLQKGF